jgi:hypothetical protein
VCGGAIYDGDMDEAAGWMSERLIPVAESNSLRRLTRQEARLEHLRYWSGKSMQERLTGMTELTRRMYRMRGIDIDERKADWTPRRIPRRKG